MWSQIVNFSNRSLYVSSGVEEVRRQINMHRIILHVDKAKLRGVCRYLHQKRVEEYLYEECHDIIDKDAGYSFFMKEEKEAAAFPT